MGEKSRGNWNINFCLEIDCKNRNIKCKECYSKIHYERYKTSSRTTSESKT